LRKIVNLELAAGRVENWRREGWQTAVTIGRYDSITEVEANILRQSRATADRLVVALERDTPQRNQPPEAVRAAHVASLECVDLVVMIDSVNPAELLHALRPDQLIGSPSQPGADLLPTWGGRVTSV
jgi:bifunctional ADP-heptose synthase (sugar kinase/adenylyltransferase)